MAIAIVLLLCTCCGVPAGLMATGQTIDLGEMTLSDSALRAMGVDKMIENALDSFFPWGDEGDESGDGSQDGGSTLP